LTLAVTPAGPPRNLLPNPSFERVGADGRTPAQWRWIPGRTDAALAVVSPGRQGGAALERFRRHGGTVLVVGDPPTRDEADRVRPSWPADGRLALATAHELWTHLRAQAPAPRVAVGVWGVEARSALLGARTVLNLCNFRREPVSVNLPAGAVDRLSGARLGRQLELASLVPRLLVLDG
jgi:hypothetical protein